MSADRTQEEILREPSPIPQKSKRVMHNFLPSSKPIHLQSSKQSPSPYKSGGVSKILHEKRRKTSQERMRVDSKGRNNFAKVKKKAENTMSFAQMSPVTPKKYGDKLFSKYAHNISSSIISRASGVISGVGGGTASRPLDDQKL